MSKTSTQVKVTLPNELYVLLKSKAKRFGLTTASYLRYLIIDDAKDGDIPTFPLNERLEKKGLKALKDDKAGKTIDVNDIDGFFENL